MSQFLHACQRANINRGDVLRAAAIIEYYLDRAGHVAITDQNARLFRYGDQRITAEQKAAAIRGDRKTFWTLRKAVGDPIADVALPILNNTGLNGRIANRLTGLSDNPLRLNELGVALMKAHVWAVNQDMDNCLGNVPGLLSPEQVAHYHHAVFGSFGIGRQWIDSSGSWLFGGTLFNLPPSLYRPVWCRACDFIAPR